MPTPLDLSYVDHITFAGDWHGTTYQALNAVEAAADAGSQVIFHLGDFGIWHNDQKFLKSLNTALKSKNIVLYFVDGNHEDFPRLHTYPLAQDGTRPIRSNIFHLPRNLTFEISNLRFTAFGGAFSVDRESRVLNRSYWAEELASPVEVHRALLLPQTDILLMHDCPAGVRNRITDDPFSQMKGMEYFGHHAIEQANAYREILRPLTASLNPTHIFHGHYHVRSQFVQPKEDGAAGLLRVTCLDEGNAGTVPNTLHTSVQELIEDSNMLREAVQ